jgi:murein DD-endopeptidase MepM/ murein hydrolase activator NlpD
MSGYGYITLIDHGGGLVTAYAHQNRLIARTGQQVAQGQQIGEVGSTGRSTGPHVHFEVRVNGAPRNPRGYLG